MHFGLPAHRGVLASAASPSNSVVGSLSMLPTALTVAGYIQGFLSIGGGFIVAVALRDADASSGAIIGGGIGAAFPGLVLGWVLLAAAEWLRTRPCPRCGERVWTGELDCRNCQFDFRTIGSRQG